MQLKNKNEINHQISTDCVICGFDFNQLRVLLIEREPVENVAQLMALPGDLIFENEDLDMAAGRILKELTGLEEIFLEQVGAFGNPNRLKKESDRVWLNAVRQDPDARVITIAYYSLVNLNEYKTQPSSFAKSLSWVLVDDIQELAFDHFEIFKAAQKKLKDKISMQPIGFNLLPEKFAFSQ